MQPSIQHPGSIITAYPHPSSLFFLIPSTPPHLPPHPIQSPHLHLPLPLPLPPSLKRLSYPTPSLPLPSRPTPNPLPAVLEPLRRGNGASEADDDDEEEVLRLVDSDMEPAVRDLPR